MRKSQLAKSKVNFRKSEQRREIALSLLRAWRRCAVGESKNAQLAVHWRARPLLDYVGGWECFISNVTQRNAQNYLELFMDILEQEEREVHR